MPTVVHEVPLLNFKVFEAAESNAIMPAVLPAGKEVGVTTTGRLEVTTLVPAADKDKPPVPDCKVVAEVLAVEPTVVVKAPVADPPKLRVVVVTPPTAREAPLILVTAFSEVISLLTPAAANPEPVLIVTQFVPL